MPTNRVLTLLFLTGAAMMINHTQAQIPTSLRGPLNLADEGMFFVNGQATITSHPGPSAIGAPTPGTIVVNQMYVHYRIPQQLTGPYPIVLVHGGGLTGMSYETTPDGREGWATYFVRKGYAVYVVDHPGRGRSGFDSTPINRAAAESPAPANAPRISRTTADLAWPAFRFGPKYGEPFKDSQFPADAALAFGAQGVPSAEVTLTGGAMGTAPAALAALLDRIGPAILFVHSQSGPFADALVTLRPKHLKAVVNVEGSQAIVPTDGQVAGYKGIPLLELFGDYLDVPAVTGGPRYAARKAVVDRINKIEGGRAAIVSLPDVGMRGNSHMVMQDRNNLQVADYLLEWLGKNVR
jgi:pimeloyl-ACP methyl ester carboxylesterase